MSYLCCSTGWTCNSTTEAVAIFHVRPSKIRLNNPATHGYYLLLPMLQNFQAEAEIGLVYFGSFSLAGNIDDLNLNVCMWHSVNETLMLSKLLLSKLHTLISQSFWFDWSFIVYIQLTLRWNNDFQSGNSKILNGVIVLGQCDPYNTTTVVG